jgi:flagellar hook protein FlgE
MANSLLTGISGLRGHQKMLEIVGNNLANLNTTAFKSSRTLFSDLMYEVQRGTSSSSSGLLGSVNSVQIGTGSRLSQVDLNFAQGNLESTGNDLDLAMDGNGFFVASSAGKSFFTRAGAFTLDDSGFLADPSTGYTINRFGSLGEPDGDLPAFQTPGDNRIYVPKGVSIPGQVSTQLSLKGNLSSTLTGPIAQEVMTSIPLRVGGNPATLTSRLSDLDANTTNYVAGDKILIGGRKVDGSTPSITSFTLTATSTVGDLVDALSAAFPGATVTLDGLGNIVGKADETGPSFLSMNFTDGPTNIGRSDFEEHEIILTATGKNADTIFQSVKVFDESGAGHTLGLTLTKQADQSWNLAATTSPTEGTVFDGIVEGISFQPNGSFAQVTGSGVADNNITIQFRGKPAPQTITLSFGTPATFDGLTALGSPSELVLTPDGFPPGELSEVQVDTDGKVYGLASNGIKIPLAQLAIASFRNTDGLVAIGNNYYTGSLASGAAEIGSALGSRGAVRSGQLEGSNVDLALEFTRLIIAQRGFSANSRTITVTDEILQELTSIIR